MSPMCRASFSLAIMPRTFKSSMLISENLRTSRVVVWCNQSCRTFAMRACKRASRSADFRRLWLPSFFRLCHRESLCQSFQMGRKRFRAGQLFSAGERRRHAHPRSMPTAAWRARTASGMSTSTGTETNQRSATRRTVVESALPEKRSSSLSFTHPITGKRTRWPSNLKVPGPLSKRAESRTPSS